MLMGRLPLLVEPVLYKMSLIMVRALFKAMADLLMAKVAMDNRDQAMEYKVVILNQHQAMEELQSHLDHMVVAQDFSLLCHM
jgi:hypothetical protein